VSYTTIQCCINTENHARVTCQSCLTGDVRKKFNLFDDLVSLLVPPGEELEDLKLATAEERQKRIGEWAKANKDALQSKLAALSTVHFRP
jgi:hypothetical protein